jgi:hypothetical protein
MSTPADKPPGAKATPAESDEIQRDIEQTRAELGDTVAELAHKVDVPARVKDKVRQTAEGVQAKTADVTAKARDLGDQAAAKLPPPIRERLETAITTARRRPMPLAAVAAVVLLVLWRLRRRGR